MRAALRPQAMAALREGKPLLVGDAEVGGAACLAAASFAAACFVQQGRCAGASNSPCPSPPTLQAAAGYAEIWPWRPQWWQPCWGHEEEGGGGDEAAGSGDGG